MSWIWCIQTFVVHSLQLLRMIMNISSLFQTITLIMGTNTCYKRNPNHWTCFKIYKAEVENQLNRKIKAIRSDHDGEYHDRHNESDKCP